MVSIKRVLLEKLVKAIEAGDIDAYAEVLERLKPQGTGDFLWEEFMQEVLTALSEKLSYSFTDYAGRRCRVYYEPARVEELPSLRGMFSLAMVESINKAEPSLLRELLERDNVIAALVEALGLEREYGELLGNIRRYSGRFNVFSLFRVRCFLEAGESPEK